MGIYEGFAHVYDEFMDEIEYDRWLAYLHAVWEKEGLKPDIIVDLGCGTGNMTLSLAEQGYDMIGIDSSEDMLARASQKALSAGLNVLFLLQDMREFELYGTAQCIISLCDSLNYITEEEDLKEVFSLVNNYLDPGGLFIFDLNTKYKFQQLFSSQTFTQVEDDAAYIWENSFDPQEDINEYRINFFVENPSTGEYARFEEIHYERAYSNETICRLIEEAGMNLVGIYDAYTFDPPRPDSERISVIAKEVQKRP